MQLRQRKTNASQDNHSQPQEPANEPHRNKTPAAYQREYRQKIKASKEIYAIHLEHERIRARLFRMKRTEEQKARDRELGRERSRRYRQKHKGEANSTGEGPAKKVTRAERQALREKWRLAKQKQRMNMSVQKRRRINEKRRESYALRNKPDSSAVTPPTNQPEAFDSNSALRKAVSRSLRILPKNSTKFAQVMSSIVKRATPKRKKALQDRIILSPTQKRRLDFLERNSVRSVIEEIKKKRSKRDLELRRLIHLATTVKNKLKKRTAHQEFGLSWNFLKLHSSQHLNRSRKKRTDAFSADKIRVVSDFYNRGDVSRDLPCASSSQKTKVMECTIASAFKMFQEENPAFRISYSLFQKLRPSTTKLMSQTKLLQCLCEYCVNIKFLLDTLNRKALMAGQRDLMISDKYVLSDLTVCSDGPDRKDCIDRNCGNCGPQLMRHNFAVLLGSHGDDEIVWKSWEMETTPKGKRMTLKQTSGSIKCLIDVLSTKLEPFAKHLANAKWQAQQFDSLRKQVPKEWVLMCMDFAENYNCHFQDEAQSAHWSYNQATVHPIVAYYITVRKNHAEK
ncbi:hypothetical protein HOLleu_06479 [Holothuria leucospilota]|uniref:Uncharacterized protein n=1 Tax=Holothuria leucospilota TaxID=206669 RepID=A0A9Q1HJN5_HOLLE|nr:hypothetical protein HOLleu_06479 [Holothuria leucospilota]